MKTLECKRVDLWDGGDRHNFGFYVSREVSNEDIVKAYPHCNVSPQVLTVFDSLAEVEANSVRELRKSAWYKLSPQERVVLNMMEEPT